MTSKDIVNHLGLLPHPEGGYYKETYRAGETVINQNGRSRNVCTAIYFLLEETDKSHFHRILSDELWFFHLGQPLEVICIFEGKLKSVVLGNNILSGELLSFRVPANTWFASRIKGEKGFGLVSCTVAPGFDFDDFELAARDKLTQEYPHLKETIAKFTRQNK
jgi:predicted cupin superfamily sugar epimerase